MFPAHAGISRRRCFVRSSNMSVPRPRGDLPNSSMTCSSMSRCSPPTRGSPFDWQFRRHGQRVFPAHAGISRWRIGAFRIPMSVPRPRGDLPTNRDTGEQEVQCSPPTRGSPERAKREERNNMVFPAHAGISRNPPATARAARRVPRPRGDLPPMSETGSGGRACSPPTRGSPGKPGADASDQHVFPAHAGISRRLR